MKVLNLLAGIGVVTVVYWTCKTVLAVDKLFNQKCEKKSKTTFRIEKGS